MVYALLAFLLGFSFNGAATRFDNRRALVGDEANAAGTAWQRIDLLPVERQPAIRTALRAYIDALIAAYAAPSGLTNVHLEPAAVTRAENDLWTLAVAACRAREGEQARMLLLPGQNELFDAVNREYIARRIHPPVVIFVMLGLTALAGAVFVGYAIASGPTRNWIYMIGVAATISAATFVIVELEYPRLGLIRVDAMDQTLAEVRATMD
jgi:hypothetical protein